MNGSGSSKNILEAEAASLKKLEAVAEALHAEAEVIKNSPLPHHWSLYSLIAILFRIWDVLIKLIFSKNR